MWPELKKNKKKANERNKKKKTGAYYKSIISGKFDEYSGLNTYIILPNNINKC
jgi:hypothetical protein